MRARERADLLAEPAADLAGQRFRARGVTGGFVTIHLVAGTTDIGTWDILFQNTVGGQAHAAGPNGADECDGVGMDDLLACLGIPEE